MKLKYLLREFLSVLVFIRILSVSKLKRELFCKNLVTLTLFLLNYEVILGRLRGRNGTRVKTGRDDGTRRRDDPRDPRGPDKI